MKPLRLRAPQEHGQVLAVPALDQVGRLLVDNQRSLNSARLSTSSQSLAELRTLARQEVLAASTQYHQEADQPVADTSCERWLVAGHQPELFHPGVWFKNFALGKLAQQHGATALNLVIDTDSAKPALLHVPSEGKLAWIAFDRFTAELPYEERIVEEETTFADFAERMQPITSRWNFEPMLASYWREVMQRAKRTPLLGERFAAARRAMERRWGVTQREVPMSRVCQTASFATFAYWVVADLPRFHALYNQTVQEYRQEHGIRSRSHPVPDLAGDGAWLEAPFWAWRRGQGRRGKLFVRHTPTTLDLRVAGEIWPSLPRHDATQAAEGWRGLESQGFKIRSRALTTTMFARLLLADVFIHGIGGGIYDELTDRILERYFAIPAPAFLTVSATLLLPLPRFPDAGHQSRDLARRWRDLVYKPELFVERSPKVEPLMAAKQDWIRRGGSTHVERAERFERIRQINGQLRPYVLTHLQELQHRLEACRGPAELEAVAGRRDYAFCLYPEEMLRTFFQSQMDCLCTV